MERLQKLMAYVRDNKVRHKWVTEVEIVDEIPKSASGKILRRMLRTLETRDRNDSDRMIVTQQEMKSKSKL